MLVYATEKGSDNIKYNDVEVEAAKKEVKYQEQQNNDNNELQVEEVANSPYRGDGSSQTILKLTFVTMFKI